MRIGVEKKWYLYVGRDRLGDARLQIVFRRGFDPDADIDTIPWHYNWEWSSSDPYSIRRDDRIVRI